jgi:hypothetical protein
MSCVQLLDRAEEAPMESSWIALPPKGTDPPTRAELREIAARPRRVSLVIPPAGGAIPIR